MVSRTKKSVGTYFRIRTNTARNYHQMVSFALSQVTVNTRTPYHSYFNFTCGGCQFSFPLPIFLSLAQRKRVIYSVA